MHINKLLRTISQLIAFVHNINDIKFVRTCRKDIEDSTYHSSSLYKLYKKLKN